jgi:uncharacterized protein YukE
MHINPLEVIGRIGQLPIGDPAAMTQHAARLRADADHLMSLVSAVSARANAMAYEGPAAQRFRSEIGDSVREAGMCHEQLYEASFALDRAASSVASSQAQWRRRFSEVEAELVAAARAAGAH